jgi:hypothetical protein
MVAMEVDELEDGFLRSFADLIQAVEEKEESPIVKQDIDQLFIRKITVLLKLGTNHNLGLLPDSDTEIDEDGHELAKERMRSRSSFLQEVESLAQTLQDRSQQLCISAALDADQRPARKLNVDRTRRHRMFMRGRLLNGGRARSRYGDRKQRGRSGN